MNNRILDIMSYAFDAVIVIDSSIISYNIINLKNFEQLSVRPLVCLGLVTINFNDDDKKKGLITININGYFTNYNTSENHFRICCNLHDIFQRI